MARIRSAKPEWWSKEKWAAVPRDVRFTYKGIWEVMTDDDGRFQADARLIKAQVWPLDDDITAKKIEKWLPQLAAITVTERGGHRSPAIVLYEVDGIRYGYLPGFVKHQKISHPTPSKLPDPEGETLAPRTNGSGNAPEDSGIPQESFAPERIRSGMLSRSLIRAGAEAAPEDFGGSPRDRFLHRFYADAKPERRAEVARQIDQLLKPEGARVRNGVAARANSPEHLNRVLSDVLRGKPPENPDSAIVFVFRKLEDPDKDDAGRVGLEITAAREKQAIAREGAYHRARRAAAKPWSEEHPDELAKIEAMAHREIPGDSEIAETTRKSFVLQRICERIGFPSFEAWAEKQAVPA